ncbi:MAG: class I SAM-dependent methyltransferase [Clostridia bacterium]|nr:class I SAM-dependent methyltransferase [Clostridia bacterium]
MEQYTSLAEYYDKLNSEVDYGSLAASISGVFERYCALPGKSISSVLDLGCGTGSLTLALHKAGFDMTAVDISEEMLAEAFEKTAKAGVDGILYLCQDMTSFELYGTVEGVVCCFDSLNYLTDEADLDKCFALVRNYLEKGGVFYFDMNTPYKFENVYGCNDYIIEADGVYCGWQNSYDPESGICEFALDIFAEGKDGSYRRFSEEHYEKRYELEAVRALLEKNGFDCRVFSDPNAEHPASDEDERWYFVCV